MTTPNGHLGKNEKVVRIGLSGFCPKSKTDYFLNQLDRLEKEEKERKQAMSQEDKDKFIAYELWNHGAHLCRSGFENVVELLKNWGFSEQEIMKVYNKRRN